MDCSNVKNRSAGKYILCLAAGLFLSVSPIIAAEEIIQRVDGNVVSVDIQTKTFVVNYEIPSTGEYIEQKFDVGDSAGFKDFKRLSDLRQGDLVSLDYIDYKPIPKAIYIIRIPLEKTYFTHKEIAQALLKVKSGDKHSNEPKN